MSFRIAIALWGIVILACYVVPYFLLDSVAHWTGAFLFWTLAGLAVILLNVVATSGFGEGDE